MSSDRSSTIIERNNLDHSLRNTPSVSAFKQNILKCICLGPNNVHNLHNPYGLRLLQVSFMDWIIYVLVGSTTMLVILYLRNQYRTNQPYLFQGLLYLSENLLYCDFAFQWKWKFLLSYSTLVAINLMAIKASPYKGYIRYKTITSQNVSSKA